MSSSTIEQYIEQMQATMSLLRTRELEAGLALVQDAMTRARGIYLCGNGGSAATASHLAVDLGRIQRRDVQSGARVVSLTDNVPWLTALSNDESYEDCFAGQLQHVLRPEDLLIGISASGDSENVVRAFTLARDRGAHRLALVGFGGGRLAELATARVWVDSYDYGVVESVHLFVGHLLVQALKAPKPDGPQRAVANACAERIEAAKTSRAADIPLASRPIEHSVSAPGHAP